MSLEIKEVSKHYGSVIAVSHADLLVEKGEVRAILGGNGSGKSTLSKIISGLVSPDTGTIFYDDKRLSFQSPKEAKRHKIVMTSQELSLFNNLTVKENIMLCDVPKKGPFTDRKKLQEKARGILEEMKLADIADQMVEDVPPNQQYMVEFAKALVQEPEVLIIDEITSALYRRDVEIVDNIICRLKKRGCIILFISHRMGELYAMCDSVTIMKNGETIGTYLMKEKNEDELLTLMVGSEVTAYHGEGKHKRGSRENVFIETDELPIDSYDTAIPLQINKGEIIGVAGLQGHGQSDLVQALFAMHHSVTLKLDQQKTVLKNPNDAVKHGFAFLSGNRERDGIFNERDLKENVSCVRELIQHEKVTDPNEVLKHFNVRYDNAKELITSLSGGNQQKVAVARWISTGPRLLLADDPTKGIDVKARTDLHMQFVELANQGNAVVMVSSDDDELVSLTSMADISKVIVMYEGRISSILERDAISRENIIAASMPGNKSKHGSGEG